MSTSGRQWRRAGLLVLAMLVLAALASRYLSPLRQATGFVVPSAAEAKKAEAAFASALAGNDTQLPPGLVAVRQEGYRVLGEKAGQCGGQGTYLLREPPALPLAIVAPHRGSDRHTGTIAASLFDESPAAAAAWNSAPRRANAGCPAGDPTRHPTHHLTAFSLAFAAAYPQGRVVQLHGFDGARRTSRAAQLADIILSQGTRTPAPSLYDLADCLSRRLHPWRVRVFPGDVDELGALENRQGQALAAAGFTGFAHIELSREVREALVADGAQRAVFGRCLATGLTSAR